MADAELLDRFPPELLDQLVALYESEWWTRGREPEAVQRALDGSTEVLAAVANGRLVGFARALSDTAFRATIFDVIVAGEWRGTGLGGRLMEEMLRRPSIASSNRVELLCLPEMAPFYERFGFVDSQPGVMRMIRGHEVDKPEG